MRFPAESELPIITYLFARARLDQDPYAIRVKPMHDEGMGSLLFENLHGYDRQFGEIIAECCFKDADGVMVSVTLNIDQYGKPYELDLWKVDFSKLQRWPAKHDIQNSGKT